MDEIDGSSNTAHRMNFGSYEQALAMVGYEAAPVRGNVDVSEAMIHIYCGVTEDVNPSYWNREYAEERWGGIVSPAGLLFTWPLPLLWTPENPEKPFPLCTSVPLPGTAVINVKQESELYEPIRVGDRLTIRDSLESISEEKRTHIGVGHFITTVATVERQDGVVVAKITNVLFRYKAHEQGSAA